MREFFLTSSLPYWILFALSLTGTLCCLRGIFAEDIGKGTMVISKKMMLCVSGIMVATSLALFGFYSFLGGNALWWVVNDDISFWSALLRTVLLMIFLISQMASPFLYMFFMNEYLDCTTLSVKSTFISVVAVVPAALIIVMIINAFTHISTDFWFYLIAGGGITAAAVYSIKKNTQATDMRTGIIYTATSFVLCAGTLISLLYFFVALVSLIFKILPAIGICVAIAIVFGKSYSNAVMRRDSHGNYIANDGSKHSTQGSRDYRDSQIFSQRNK